MSGLCTIKGELKAYAILIQVIFDSVLLQKQELEVGESGVGLSFAYLQCGPRNFLSSLSEFFASKIDVMAIII